MGGTANIGQVLNGTPGAIARDIADKLSAGIDIVAPCRSTPSPRNLQAFGEAVRLGAPG